MSDSKAHDRRGRGRDGSLLGIIIVLLAIVLAGLSLKGYVHERGHVRETNIDAENQI